MGSRSRVLLLLPVFLFGLTARGATEPMPRQGWIGLRATNFYVIGDVGARDLREVARRLEQFREAIGVMFPKAVLTTITPTTVVVFRSHKSYEPMKPLYNGKPRKDIAGFFQPGRSLNYVTFTMEEGIERLDIVYHEYVHLIVNNNVPNVPLWFNEGLAEYYRTFTIATNGKQATLGKVNADHVYLLRSHFLPLADLVLVDHKSPLYNESARSSIFYAESWALVHYLLVGNDQKYAAHASNFVAALADGIAFDNACQRELGITGDTLQKELRNYVQHEMFAMQGVRFSERVGKIDDLPVTPVSEAEVHATLGDVLLSMGRISEAQGEVQRALALDAGSASAHTSLGLIAARADRWDEARKELELAVASPSATFVSYYAYADALARSESAATPGDGAKVEQALRRAIALNPSYPDAYGLLAWQLEQSDSGIDEGLAVIAKAITLAPGREEYPLRAASLLAKKQEFARARALLEQIIKSGTEASVRADAQQMLAGITDFERRKAEFEAAHARAGSAPDSVSASGETTRAVPALRPTQPGEKRVFGALTAIECGRGPVVVVVRTPAGAVVHAHAVKFSQVALITYREDLRGAVQCGARTPPDPVLLTFMPDGGSDIAGTAVAVEFVPRDYSP